jgi:D-serine deaminase-like pyridoxal phosphate-dependent protein
VDNRPDRAGEVLDWRFRAVPVDWHGRTPAEVVAAKPRLFDDAAPDGPVAVLDGPALAHNIRAMAEWCASAGVSIAPHGKTTMAPALIAAQLAAGAWGVTVASLNQARMVRTTGANPVVVANEVVAGLAWVCAEQRRDPDFRLLCWVDSTAGVALLEAGLAVAGAPRPLDVLVEVGTAGGRTGCRSPQAAVDVARAAARSPHLRLVGVSGYEGILPDLSAVDTFLAGMREVAQVVDELGLFGDVDEVILSAGGSAYFDRVAETLHAPLDRPCRTLIRSGCYLTHDSGYYARLTPAARQAAGAPRFRDALRVWARVLSRPEPGLALLAAGRRDVPFDQGLPTPVDRPGWRVTELNDQHAFVTVPPDAQVRVGEWVALGVSHPCTLFDRWNLLPVLDDGVVVDLVRTYF